MPTQAATKRVTLLSGATVGTDPSGTSPWVNVQDYNYLVFYFRTTGNPGAGTCVIEEADFNPDVAAPGTFTASALVTVDIDVSVGTDGMYAYHPAPAAYSFVRARIGTTVTVATLGVTLVAN